MMCDRPSRGRLSALALVAMGLIVLSRSAAVGAAEAPVYVWQEAEAPAEVSFEYYTGGGRDHLLSGGRLLGATVSPADQEKIPEEGLLATYRLRVPQAGEYEAWARVGFEFIRSPFQWRIDDGPWREGPADALTTNVMQLADWNEIAWLYLGPVRLDRGEATLTVRYTEPGSNGNMMISLDCFAFVLGHWVPEGKLKPGERYESETDLAAARQVYRMPEPAGGAARTEVALNGLWQLARYDDPDMDVDTLVPVLELPSPEEYPLRWMGVEVPGSVWNKDETVLAHRVIFRTRVDVPAAHAGRGFKLHFSGTNLFASVFVNGELAGTHRGVWIPWDLDVSGHIRPGEANEIAVAIKGPYYAVDKATYARAEDLDHVRNRPRGRQDWVFFIEPIYPSTKGDGNGVDYGLVNPMTLVAVGDAYTEDVFIKPGLDRRGNKRLETDVTVRNTAADQRTFEVTCEAVYEPTGQVEKSFGPATVTVPPGQSKMVRLADLWEDPKLWWPGPDPHLYVLRTTVGEAGRPLDVQEELFGFRWVTIKREGIYINNVRRNFWNWVGVQGRPWSEEEWLKAFRQENNRFTRFSQNRKTSRFLRSREERLEFYDRNGIPGRLCSMIDGMFINRTLGNRTSNPVNGQPWLDPNWPVWEGFTRHMDQLTRAYRNHPSVIMYQVENELIYITGMNIYGGYLDRICDLMNDVIEVARTNDPTRPYTVGGAGDLLDRLEINSPHYPVGDLDWYPENAYTVEKFAPKHDNWPWRRQKPWVVGESAFAAHLRYGSYVLGDRAFRSAEDEKVGKARYLRMLYGGYRWAGVAGFFPWDNLHGYEDADKVFSDLYVVPRRQTDRLYAGRENRLLFKVMNDTLSDERVTLEWNHAIGDERVAGRSETMRIDPGFGREVTLTIRAPQTDKRLDGVLTLKASQPGVPDYVDERPVPVLPVVGELDVASPVTVFDRSGAVAGFLAGAGLEFERIGDLAESRGREGVLVVGPDSLTAEEAFGRDLLSFAGQGGRVIVLEQEIQAAGANLPAPLRTTTHTGGYAHPKALGTPLFEDLGADDLIDWAGGHPVYKNVYEKPTQGARSLAECGPMLPYAPLIEMPAGDGVIVLCQLRVGANLGKDAAADVLLRNLLRHYAGYRPATGVAALYAPGDRLLAAKVNETGSLNRAVGSVAEALDQDRFQVAVIEGTEANLAALNAAAGQARAFQDAGGWIMVAGLRPDAIEEYNRLVGADHMIRPFRMERVTLESPEFPLAATLGNRELALYSAQHLQHSRYWISQNEYSYVIDGLDAAPFTRPPGAPEDIMVYEPTRDDHDPYNFVNGMLSSDHWRYIRQIWLPEEGPEPLVFRFRRPETIAAVRVWNNAAYWTIEDLDIIVDGDEANAYRMTMPDSAAMVELTFPEPTRVEQSINVQIRSWRVRRPDRPDVRLVGIDNVQFLRPRTPGDSVFIDNVGGLVAYPRGEGGIFLNQLKFMAEEPNRENAAKKLNVLGVVLQNMGVGSRTASVALPGVNLRFTPVEMTDDCTQYLTDREGRIGWFGQRGRDMRSLLVGEQVMADVRYHLVDYATAPVPDCIVLGAQGAPEGMPQQVTGIEVGRKADVLFFLHTANVRRPIRDNERTRRGFELPEVLRYVIHYADGETVEIPVVLEANIDHWLKADPKPLEGALVGATVAVPGVQDQRGVLYSMQAPNPRPDVEIAAIDVALGESTNRAVPAVLAITLGEIIE